MDPPELSTRNLAEGRGSRKYHKNTEKTGFEDSGKSWILPQSLQPFERRYRAALAQSIEAVRFTRYRGETRASPGSREHWRARARPRGILKVIESARDDLVEYFRRPS